MNNKRFFRLFWRKSLPLVIIYLLLVGLLALLLTLYRLPRLVLFDFLRFSLPFLIIWFFFDYYRLRKKAKVVHKGQPFSPTTPVEDALFRRSQAIQSQQQTLVSQLHDQQQRQMEQIELYSHEIKNSLTSLQAAAENQAQVGSNTVKQAVSSANYHLNMLLNDERLAMPENDFSFEWINLAFLIDQILKDNSASFIN